MTRTILNKLIATHNALGIPSQTGTPEYAAYSASGRALDAARKQLREDTMARRRAKWSAAHPAVVAVEDTRGMTLNEGV